ncbi:hypothetical protein [Microbispora sp. NPDC049125]|uniref:hypothetical protein n=1 Tax=Microbispora sp. NPDC049125 TaxID=3154929 RepID=UPI00346507DF
MADTAQPELPYGDLAIALSAGPADLPLPRRAERGVERLGGRDAVAELSRRWTELNLALIGEGIQDDIYVDRMRQLGLDPDRLQALAVVDWARLPR